MSAIVVPSKQDIPKELKLVVTTLSDDAQRAALKECQELAFDTSKGMISLEETFISLSSARDILLDAVDKKPTNTASPKASIHAFRASATHSPGAHGTHERH